MTKTKPLRIFNSKSLATKEVTNKYSIRNNQELKHKLKELQIEMEKIRQEDVTKQSAIIVKEKDLIITDHEKACSRSNAGD